MRKKIILVCEECFSRNYQTTKSIQQENSRISFNKFCSKCNKHTLHKETK